MIAIIDYDAGNIKSVEKACAFLGKEAVVTRDKEVILRADHVILPGVGAFGVAMEKIRSYGLEDVIKEVVGKGTPFMGICLGLQLLFEESEESPGVKGLSILPGKIRKIPAKEGLKIPHIGWNSLTFPKETRLFEKIEDQSYVYFVHSYYLDTPKEEIVAAMTEYGIPIQVAVEAGNVYASQFHPEKSSDVGLQILQNFLNVVTVKEEE